MIHIVFVNGSDSTGIKKDYKCFFLSIIVI